MLAGVDTRVELLEDLVVAGEESSIEHFRVAQVYGGLERVRGDYDALLSGGELQELQVEVGKLAGENGDFAGQWGEAGSLDEQLVGSGSDVSKMKLPIGIGGCQCVSEMQCCAGDGLALRIGDYAAQLRVLGKERQLQEEQKRGGRADRHTGQVIVCFFVRKIRVFGLQSGAR